MNKALLIPTYNILHCNYSDGRNWSPSNSNEGGSDHQGVILFGSSKVCDSIRCEFGAICEIGEDSYPRCTCQSNCTTHAGPPICASDLKLYSTECEMRKEACHRQTELRPRPMELCEGICKKNKNKKS